MYSSRVCENGIVQDILLEQYLTETAGEKTEFPFLLKEQIYSTKFIFILKLKLRF